MEFKIINEAENSKIRSTIFTSKLAKICKANAYKGISNVKFPFALKDGEINKSNVLAGKYEDYEYCLCEYYHSKSGKHDHSRWIIEASVKLKDKNIPDFTIKNKKSELTNSIIDTIFLTPFFVFVTVIASFLIYGGIYTIYHGITKGRIPELFFEFMPLSFFALFISFFVFFIYKAMFENLKTLLQLLTQGKYKIKNQEFKKRYAIFSSDKAISINKVFTNEICTRILRNTPKIEKLEVRGKCLHFKIDDQLLTDDNIIPLIEGFINHARIFDLENPPINIAEKRLQTISENICNNKKSISEVKEEIPNKYETSNEFDKDKFNSNIIKPTNENTYNFNIVTDKKHVINKFGLFEKFKTIENTNIITGTSNEGYELCLYEYSTQKSQYNVEWKIGSAIKLKNSNIPDFKVINIKEEERSIWGCSIIMIPLIMFFIPFFLVGLRVPQFLLFSLIPGVLIFFWIKAIVKLNIAKNRFGSLKSYNFSQKFAFEANGKDVNQIKRVFQPGVCKNFVNNFELASKLVCKKGCLQFENDGQLSNKKSNEIAQKMICSAKLLDDYET